MKKEQINTEFLKEYLGFGVAGNFANHLDEAGESVGVEALKIDKDAPVGLFPFYIPHHNSFLGEYPISEKHLNYNNCDKLQVEAEIALVCDFEYEQDKILDIKPKLFTAFNDCSIRVNDGSKLSTKKNWGKSSKGISNEFIPIDNFSENGILRNYNITSFIKRDGKIYDYGTTSAVKSYSYFFDTLKDWMIDKLNKQEDSGFLENLDPFLKNIKNSKGLFIAAGATAYTDFGKNNFLKKADEVFIYIYNSKIHSFNEIMDNVEGKNNLLEHCSKLHQIVK